MLLPYHSWVKTEYAFKKALLHCEACKLYYSRYNK